jgi:hypothetical protein
LFSFARLEVLLQKKEEAEEPVQTKQNFDSSDCFLTNFKIPIQNFTLEALCQLEGRVTASVS